MAIYTRFGSHIKITNGNLKNGKVTFSFIDDDLGTWVESHVSELKADNGLKEIEDAIKEANK